MRAASHAPAKPRPVHPHLPHLVSRSPRLLVVRRQQQRHALDHQRADHRGQQRGHRGANLQAERPAMR